MADHFEAVIRSRIEYLENITAKKKAALQNVPEGRLRCSRIGGTVQYFKRVKSNDTTGTYIPVAQKELAQALAQKTYDQDVLKTAGEELKQLLKLEEKRRRKTIEKIYEKYGTSRKALVNPVSLPDDEYVEQWLSKPYNTLGFTRDDPEFYSERGMRVRSKSEVFIADMLDDLGVPYRYEEAIFLKGRGWVYPDFTVMNVRLRKTFLWEHLGRMDDPDYCKKNLGKLEDYEKNGYFPGKNLILTMEIRDRPVSPPKIKRIVETYLL